MTGKVFVIVGDSGGGKSYAAKTIFGADKATSKHSARHVTVKEETYTNNRQETVVDCVGLDHPNKLPDLRKFENKKLYIIVLLISTRTDDKLKQIAKNLDVKTENLKAYFGYRYNQLEQPEDTKYPRVGTFDQLREDYNGDKLKPVTPKTLNSQSGSPQLGIIKPKFARSSKKRPKISIQLLCVPGLLSARSLLSEEDLHLDRYKSTILISGIKSLSWEDIKAYRQIGETHLKLQLQIMERQGLPIDIGNAMGNNKMRRFLEAHDLVNEAKLKYANGKIPMEELEAISDQKLADVLEAVFGAYMTGKQEENEDKPTIVLKHFFAAYMYWCLHNKVSENYSIHP